MVGRCVSWVVPIYDVASILTMTDLEVSKPQKNSRKAETQAPIQRRRSRSPDYSRGGNPPGPRDGRYVGNLGPMSPRERDRRFRDRDDYRMRSPSPRGNARGMRSRDRSRDRYDGRYRSRSRTPPRRRRSPSPRQDYTEDGLDLRRRLPHEVPDIQILVLNESLSRYVLHYSHILWILQLTILTATSFAMSRTYSEDKTFEATCSS